MVQNNRKNATTEENVQTYAESLENAITNYKNIFGYNYVFIN